MVVPAKKLKLQSFMANVQDSKRLDRIGKKKGVSRSALIRFGMKLVIATDEAFGNITMTEDEDETGTK